MKEDYYWDLPTCMWCGEVCDLVEFINSPKEMWCYCKKCKVDTFHKPVNAGDEYDD